MKKTDKPRSAGPRIRVVKLQAANGGVASDRIVSCHALDRVSTCHVFDRVTSCHAFAASK